MATTATAQITNNQETDTTTHQKQQQPQQQQQMFNNTHQPQRPRSPSLEKYRKIEKERQPTPDDEIRVTGQGRVGRYVSYAAKLFQEQEKEALTIRATGKAVSIAVSVCEVIKRRFKGLHQLTTIGWTEIIDEYEPISKDDGLELRSEKRNVPSITIILTKNDTGLDKTAVGYQEPLDESLVEERDSEELSKPRPRQRRSRGGPHSGPKPEGHEGEDNKQQHSGEERPTRGGRGGRGRGGRGRGRGRRSGPNNRGPKSEQQQQQPQEQQAVKTE